MKDLYLMVFGLLFFVLIYNFLVSYIKSFFNRNKDTPKQKYYNFKRFREKITADSFRIRTSILNPNERLFFEQLKLAIGEQYDIYPQVSLIAIFQPIKQWHNRGEVSRLNKIIDFVLFDKNIQTPKIAIELDGYSHSNPKNFDRDEFVNDIFKKFNIPLVRFNNGNYSAEEIKNKLSLF